MGEVSHNKYNKCIYSHPEYKQKSYSLIRKGKQCKRKWGRQWEQPTPWQAMRNGAGGRGGEKNTVYREFKNSNKSDYKSVYFLSPPCSNPE